MAGKAKVTPAKPRKCKHCRTKFVPERPFIVWCSHECGAELAKAKIARQNALKAKKERKEYRDAKERIKTRGDYAREAQIAINAYRRELTRNLGCISCGTHNGKMNGGHYRSVGSSPETRFIEENIWCQCERCNSYLSGNLINYRKNLIKRIGIERVEWLEGNHEPQKYTIQDLKSIACSYRIKLSKLKADSNG